MTESHDMIAKKSLVERRGTKKFKPKKGVFAVLTSDVSRLGPIKEISRGGLAFQYVDSGEPSRRSEEVEIFSTVHDFYLKKLPVRSVEDSEAGDTPAYSSLPMRELSIQFGKMTPVQLRLLDFFIRHYTDDED